MQLEIIRALQELRTPPLTFVLEVITTVGGPAFYLLILPLIFWLSSPRVGYRFLIVVLISIYLNSLLKDAGPSYIASEGPLYTVRPYLSDAQVWTCRRDPAFDPGALLARLCYEEESRSFPSGHAQTSIVVWSYLALLLRRRWFSLIALAAVALIGLSRIYLGQHWPTDVLGGWLIGLLLLGGALWFFRLWERQPGRLNRFLLAAMAVLVPLLLLLDSDPTANRARALGLIAGSSIGYALQRQSAPFHARAPWPVQLLKLLIGVVGIGAIQLGLAALAPETWLVGLLLALLIGLWVTLVAPLIFGWLFGRPAPPLAEQALR